MFVASLALSEVVTEAKTSLTGVCQLSSFEVSPVAIAEVNIDSNFFMESFLITKVSCTDLPGRQPAGL
jgi:hypothetical protein